jgi:hypothetical protein
VPTRKPKGEQGAKREPKPKREPRPAGKPRSAKADEPGSYEPKKRPSRGRPGRPPEDRRDQITVDLAAAIQATTGLGPQRARDLAALVIEGGHFVTPEMVPLRSRPEVPTKLQVPKLLATKGKPGWTQASLEMPEKTFAARSKTIRKKMRAGMVPRPAMVKRIAALLRQSEDPEALIRVALQLIILLRAGHN